MSGRSQRFERLYAAERGSVMGYVLRRAESVEDAADVIAEVFLIAWRRLDDVPDGLDTRLWLYGVARRVLANQRRGERRRSALTDRMRAEARVEAGWAELEPTGSRRLGDLADAFARLSATDREVLALESWEGLEPDSIAAVLGCSRNAARIRLHRARRRLRALVAVGEDGQVAAPVRIFGGEPA